MNSDTPSQASSTGQTAAEKQGTVQVAVLVMLLIIAFVSGGYYFGTQANFKNMSGAGGDTVGGGSDNETATFGGFWESSQLKKAYWLHSSGYERAGHKIKVYLNGNYVGKFFRPDETIECTKFLKPGRNNIVFDSRTLPVDQRQDYSGAFLKVQLLAGEKKMDGERPRFENGYTVMEIQRTVTDTDDNKVSKEFETLE